MSKVQSEVSECKEVENCNEDGKDLVVDDTSIIVGVCRLLESLEPNPIIFDPYVMLLIGQDGMAKFNAATSAIDPEILQGVRRAPSIRARFGDELCLTSKLNQIVILASGLDTRAWRLTFDDKCRLFEVDRSNVFMHKKQKLPTSKLAFHKSVMADVTDENWADKLIEEGFDATLPTLWLVEGLLMYLTTEQVSNLFITIHNLSAANSRLYFDQLEDIQKEVPVSKLLTGSFSSLGQLTNDYPILREWKQQMGISMSEDGEYFGKEWKPIRGENNKMHAILYAEFMKEI